jgi:purine nucleoside phosphorylase
MVFVIGVIGGSGFYTFFGDDARSVTIRQVGSHQVPYFGPEIARRILGG